VSAALSAWWSNPVTAFMLAGVLGVGTFLVLAGLLGVVRLGSIQFAGLLSSRKQLLPGVGRTLEAAAAAAVFLVAAMGALWVLLTAAVWRAATTAGLGEAAAWVFTFGVWLLLVASAARATQGPRAESFAVIALHLLRPMAPVIALFARVHEQAQEKEEGSENAEDEVDEHEVRAFIGAGEEAGILEHEEAELVASIVELSETVAREIMTPRTDVVALPIEASFDTVKAVFAESMFTRLPVYRESLDHIEGVVHVKDVLRAVASGANPTARELMRPVLMVPETKPLRDLLRQFQASRQQLAVVLDEYGGTAGIVTLEDVLEEIVGEIQDEHQQEAPEVEREADGAYLIAGSAHVETLAELFGVELDEEAAYDSVAGLVLEQLGRLPRPGERIQVKGLEVEVLEVERRRLKRLRVRPAPQGERA
jgi:CBS domain containing-hemolysin-like protein